MVCNSIVRFTGSTDHCRLSLTGQKQPPDRVGCLKPIRAWLIRLEEELAIRDARIAVVAVWLIDQVAEPVYGDKVRQRNPHRIDEEASDRDDHHDTVVI